VPPALFHLGERPVTGARTADNGAVSGLKEELMTTPQQPDADSPDEAEEIEDLLAPAETQQQVAGGMMDDCCATHEGSEGGGRG
jgi:hypothetical protein